MRVAFFSQVVSRGAFRSAFAGYCHALDVAGMEALDLIALDEPGDPALSPFPARVRPIRLASGRARFALPALCRHLGREQPDVLITGPIIPNLVGCLARLIARWRGRLVLSHHHPIALAHAADWRDNRHLARLLYRRADASIAVSPEVRDDVIALARLDPERVRLVPNVVVAPPGTSPPPHPWLGAERPRGPVLVSVSRLVPLKRVDLLLEAFALAAVRLDARLLILGDGPGRAGLERHLATLGLAARATLLGRVASIWPYLQHADGFVLASEEEGFGQVLAEALAAGLPVASTDAKGGGARFVLDHGRFGLLLPRGDREALATAMVTLADPDTRARLSALARKRRRAFTPETVGPRLRAFLAEVVRERR